MTELSPCPFCNRQLEHDTKIEATRHPKIPYEEYCPLAGFSFASDRADIISAWNRRTDLAATPPSEPDAWQWRACIGGRWGSWMDLNAPIERFTQVNKFNLDNGTYELRPLYAVPRPLRGEG